MPSSNLVPPMPAVIPLSRLLRVTSRVCWSKGDGFVNGGVSVHVVPVESNRTVRQTLTRAVTRSRSPRNCRFKEWGGKGQAI
jgi:hypothetical protein